MKTQRLARAHRGFECFNGIQHDYAANPGLITQLLWVTLLSSAALAVALTLAFWPPRLTRTSGRIAQQ